MITSWSVNYILGKRKVMEGLMTNEENAWKIESKEEKCQSRQHQAMMKRIHSYVAFVMLTLE